MSGSYELSPLVPDVRCPVMDCHMGPDANIYVARVTAPDGRARTVWACVKHLGLVVDGKALGVLRTEPYE